MLTLLDYWSFNMPDITTQPAQQPTQPSTSEQILGAGVSGVIDVLGSRQVQNVALQGLIQGYSQGLFDWSQVTSDIVAQTGMQTLSEVKDYVENQVSELVHPDAIWRNIESTCIESVRWIDGEFYVKFLNSGEVYSYSGVGRDIFQDFMKSDSKGRYLNFHIKKSFPYQRIGRV